MATSQQTLEDTIASIHQRWGDEALRPLTEVTTQRGGFAAGVPLVDRMLGSEGIPRGALTLLSGCPSSGSTTLVLNAVATAQAQNEIVVYLDGSRALDPEHVAACGINLSRLLVVHPDSLALGLDIAQDILLRDGAGLIILDTRSHFTDECRRSALNAGSLRRLKVTLARTAYALVCLASPADDAFHRSLAQAADVHLQLENRRWVYRESQVWGCETHITAVKNRFAPVYRAVSVLIHLYSGSRRPRP